MYTKDSPEVLQVVISLCGRTYQTETAIGETCFYSATITPVPPATLVLHGLLPLHPLHSIICMCCFTVYDQVMQWRLNKTSYNNNIFVCFLDEPYNSKRQDCFLFYITLQICLLWTFVCTFFVSYSRTLIAHRFWTARMGQWLPVTAALVFLTHWHHLAASCTLGLFPHLMQSEIVSAHHGPQVLCSAFTHNKEKHTTFTNEVQ